ncbi:MAG: alpha/beta hydrolase [Clostridia bacterium]
MKKVILYIHGKGGSADEAERYKKTCQGYDIFGLDYKFSTPWETKDEFACEYERLMAHYDSVIVIANSIGAFFTMNALYEKKIEKAFFISPIVNMEKLILDMMMWANVTEKELSEKKEIATAFGETLSWEYLCYVREHQICWNIPTHILYGEKDNLTSYETISAFHKNTNSSLTVMKDGEHWFHTKEQLAFLDCWIEKLI